MKNKIINKSDVNYFIIITQTCLFSTSFYFMVVSTYSTYQEALKRRLEPSPRIFEIDPLPFNFVAKLNINIS